MHKNVRLNVSGGKFEHEGKFRVLTSIWKPLNINVLFTLSFSGISHLI